MSTPTVEHHTSADADRSLALSEVARLLLAAAKLWSADNENGAADCSRDAVTVKGNRLNGNPSYTQSSTAPVARPGA